MESKFIILKKFYNQALAQMYKLQLEDAGIPTFISYGISATMLPISGDEVSLTIKEEDLEDALIIVKQIDLNLSKPVEEDYHDVDQGDIEYLKNVHEFEKEENTDQALRSFVSVIIIIIILLAIIFGFSYF